MADDAVSVTLCLGPLSVPTGVLELVLATTVRMSSSEILRAAAATGSTCTRTANFCAPNTSTWAIPGSCEICCASVISPYSSTTDNGKVAETKLIYMTGKSPGLTFRKLGGMVISTGNFFAATVSAVCTSSAAPSMLRLRSNWIVRSEEHTSELQSLRHLVCRLLLEKKKKNITTTNI